MNSSSSHLDDELEQVIKQQAKEIEAITAHAALLWKTLDDFRRYQAVNAHYLLSPFSDEVDRVLRTTS